MLSIDLSSDNDPDLVQLTTDYPEFVKNIAGKKVVGAEDAAITLFFAAAAIAVPAIRAILVERIRAGRYKSISYKGVKYQGYSARDIERIRRALKDDGHDL